ncbi:hypothetical protein [Acidovorax sp.]|uniref:hypothetical protein n=1 Tax=Acidovorax sp. TaxID=1872122 RepID=UPI00391F3EE0
MDELPQPSSAKHTPLPRIRWLPYDIARLQLVEFGWHPILRHPNTRDDPDIRYGNGPHYWEKGFQEIVCASPTGTAACTFAFKDAYGHVLEVATEGEAEADIDSEAIVMSWRIQDALTSSAPSTTTPVPERHAIKVNRRLTPTNILDSIEVGTPPEKVRERLGIPDLVLVDTWQYRFVDTQVEILFETGHVHSVVIALVQNYKYHGQDATFGDFVLGNMTIGDVSDMGHKHIEYRDSMRTKEVIVPMRVGPTGAWSECFFGALVVFSGAGVLAETEFDWAHTEGRLCSPAQSTVFNWVGIGGSGGEPPYFSWFIKP